MHWFAVLTQDVVVYQESLQFTDFWDAKYSRLPTCFKDLVTMEHLDTSKQ